MFGRRLKFLFVQGSLCLTAFGFSELSEFISIDTGRTIKVFLTRIKTKPLL